MAVFVIFRVALPDRMRSAIDSSFPSDNLYLGHNEWLVSSSGTAKDVSDKLGISDNERDTGSAIVFRMENYYGRAPSNIWEWIKTKAESSNG